MSKPINVMVDAHVACEPDIQVPRFMYGPEKALKTYEQAKEVELKKWVKDFKDFLRDHRSQDEVELSVVADYEDQCSKCGNRWETMIEDGKEFCAHCGDPVEPAEAKV